MGSVLVQLINIGYRIFRVFLHYFCAIINGFHGQRVPPVKDHVLLMSATELAKLIREQKLTSELVVQSYINRILEIEPFINATVDRRFEDALDDARDVDSFVASEAMTKEQLEKEKPLLGVPISVKILITVKGFRCTAGSLLLKDLRAEEDAVPVTLMKKAGAIVLVSTNSSEAGLNFQSSNYVHGTTLNPYDTSRTSGGSSGGESALLAGAGSVIGLGNDMAGSIRVPCMFTGLFGHKPSRGLVSNAGVFPVPGAETLRLLSTGPMCRYAQDLVTSMKILTSPDKISLKFEQQVDFKNIKVYYLLSYGDNIPFTEKVDPDIQNAVTKVVSHFKKQGSKTEEVNIPLFKKSVPIYFHNLLSSIRNVGDIITAGTAKLDGLREFAKFLCLQSKFTFGYVAALNAHKLPFIYNPDMVDFYKKLENKLLDQVNSLLDNNSVFIMPPIPFPAPYNNEITFLLGSTGYSSIFNVLGLPSTQCPVGLNKQGLPIGVQIIGQNGNDPLTVSCALEVEKAFGGWKPPK